MGERTAIGVTRATGTFTAFALHKALQLSGLLTLLALACLTVLTLLGAPALAQSGDRSLYIHYTHTGETARITFRKNGRYDQAGLRQLNHFLRDWRRDEATEMDPALFDLIWTVYQEVGASQPVTVVSAYRAPATNEMLRARSSGVAENSRHTQGMAMDFYIPGVPLPKLREVAMRHQVGGVGYYPTSGSPFVHLDTGNVRAWPRMTRAQLQNIFPQGRTLHLPAESDTPLSAEGRRYAMAEWQRCKSVPCVNGSTPNTQVTTGGGGNGRNLLDMIFGGDGDQVDTIQVASNTRTATPTVSPASAPTPATRATFLDYRNPQIAPVPALMPQTLLVATRQTDSGSAIDAATGLGTFNTSLDPISVASIAVGDQPTPRDLLNRELPVITAYAPTTEPQPDAQQALEMLIERRNLTQAAPAPAELRGSFQTASLGNSPEISLNDAASFFANTWAAVQEATMGSAEPAVAQLTGGPAYELFDTPARAIELTAPDLNVGRDMLISASMANAPVTIAFIAHGDFSPSTQLGVHCKSMKFTTTPHATPADQFAAQRPIFVASL